MNKYSELADEWVCTVFLYVQCIYIYLFIKKNICIADCVNDYIQRMHYLLNFSGLK